MLPKIFTHILVILLNFRFNSIEFLKLHENAINHAKCNINGQLINIYLNNTEKLMIMIKKSCRLTNIGMQKVAILNSFIYKIFISDDTILEG